MGLTALLTLAVIAVATTLSVLGRRLARKDAVLFMVLVAMVMVAMLWIPRTYRNVVVGLIGAGVLFLGSAGIFAVVVGGLTVLLGYVIPGGSTVIALGIIAIVGFFEVRGALRHLRRMRRARALRPGVPPEGDVELFGRVWAQEPLRVPGTDTPCVLWQVTLDGIDKHSEAPVEIRAAAGSARFEPAGATLLLTVRTDLGGDAELRAKVAAAVGLPAPGKSVTDALGWLAEGDAAYVMGRPVWEPAPPGMGAYRDAPSIPTFRGQAFLADREEAEVARDSTWTLATWLGWGAAAAAVAALQALWLA